MQEIVDSVRRVTVIMGEISTASVEQSSGLEQINQAIAQMDGVTQQNATLVQDLGNTVRSLTGEANDLQHSINVLNTGKKAGSALVAQAGKRTLEPSSPQGPGREPKLPSNTENGRQTGRERS